MPRGFDSKAAREDSLQWSAFVAGFLHSGEGYNGEYPKITPMDQIRKDYDTWRKSLEN